MTTIAEEDMRALSKYERHFRTAVNAGWASYPGSRALDEIGAIYKRATGDGRRINKSCGHCILSLLRDCGRLYFENLKKEG